MSGKNFTEKEKVDKKNFFSRFGSKSKNRASSDRGELSQTLIWISAFAVASITAIGGIAGVSLTKGEDTARCINNASFFKTGSIDRETCATAGTSDGGDVPNPGGDSSVTPGEPIGGDDEGSSEVPEEQDSLLDYTDESCFETDGNGTITKYLLLEKPIICTTDVVISEEINGERITEIGDYAFHGYTFIEKAITLGLIDTNAASEAEPGSPESAAILQPFQISSIQLPGSIKKIGDYSFALNRIPSIVIPNSVTHIGDHSFSSNKIHSVVIPNSVTHIGMSALFSNELVSIDIPDSITHISSGVFMSNKLEVVNIPEGVVSIEKYAFNGNNLVDINLPDSVENIGSWAFSRNSIEKFVAPKNLTLIGDSSFRSNNILDIDFSKTSSNLKIENRAFEYNDLSGFLYLPDNIESVGHSAFTENSLTNVSVGKNTNLLANMVNTPFEPSVVVTRR